MPKITGDTQDTVTQKVLARLLNARTELTNRQLLYSLRRGFYDGTIRPQIERGHDLIFTQYPAVIVERMSAYFMANGFTIKLKSQNVDDEAQNLDAEYGNRLMDRLYNNSAQFAETMLDVAQVSSLYGDAPIITKIKDGLPLHYVMSNPQNVILGFRDDQYKELDFYAYDQNVDPAYILDTYDVEVGAMPLPKNQYVVGGDGYSTHNNPYGINGMGFNNYPYLSQPIFLQHGEETMAKYTVVHDLIENKRTQLFNDMAHYQDDAVLPMYLFLANVSVGNPTGLCDFEFVAHLIQKYDEKLSEMGDTVSMAVHPKIVTDQNTEDFQSVWKPNRTQAIKVPSNAGQPGRFEVLNTAVNATQIEPLLNELLNTIRTGSGLQELGQDQIAANVSGRAIAYMFQGVVQQVKKKRIRLGTILNQMVVDDIEYLSKSSSEIKKVFFNEQGQFKFQIDVKYPPVLEQDEQIRIANIQALRQAAPGQEPLISAYTARVMLSDYVDDPIEESKRIQAELIVNAQRQVQIQAATIQAEGDAQNQVKGDAQQSQQQAQGGQGGQGPSPIMPQGMGPQEEQGPGVPSAVGQPGSAQSGISAQGMMAQMSQNSSGNSAPQSAPSSPLAPNHS